MNSTSWRRHHLEPRPICLSFYLQVHGEVTNPEVDVFDREKVFIETVLRPLIQKFPRLKVVMEHITTMDAVRFVESCNEGIFNDFYFHHHHYSFHCFPSSSFWECFNPFINPSSYPIFRYSRFISLQLCLLGSVAATVTPQHLVLNRNSLFQGGLQPHNYCLPVLKRETHSKYCPHFSHKAVIMDSIHVGFWRLTTS